MVFLRPKLNLIYHGTGNPPPGPNQRPGRHRWSMTIFARDADTGVAKWVYQMTPHDEWTRRINEIDLADQDIGGATVPTLVHFDRNGLGYTLIVKPAETPCRPEFEGPLPARLKHRSCRNLRNSFLRAALWERSDKLMRRS